jgi:ribosomal protein S12 methylthiotransferase
LRTTLLVGHPGETKDDFQELMEFVQKSRFERMGAFVYSNEDGTYSDKHYKDDISAQVKQSRLDEIMLLQQQISSQQNQLKVGKKFKVIIDREEPDFFVGRTEFDSPEVDPEVLIEKNNSQIKIGNFYTVLINNAEEIDLYGNSILKQQQL